MIGVEDYGYWQLYIFYSSYVGFFHLGWNDGIYLRYGGYEYNDLNKLKLFSQFLSLLMLQIFFSVLLTSFSNLLHVGDKLFILRVVSLNMIITNSRFLFLYILQATNRIKDNANIMIIDRALFVLFIFILLITGSKNYKLMVFSDVMAKGLSFIYSMWLCKDIAFQKISNFHFDSEETFQNINSGIKLLFANLASSLIIGVVRFGIERGWDVVTFGKVSLTLSISNFMMVFINGIGIVMYPLLRRTSSDRLKDFYSTMRDFLMTIAFGLLIFYYPFRVILSAWLPAYKDSLVYMALLFPMVVFEGKTSLLINTYFKTLREERKLMKINIISLVFSIAMTMLTTAVFKNLHATVLTILIVGVFRSALSELFLSKRIDINVVKDIILEITLTVIFVVSSWKIHSWVTVLVYGISYVVYISIKKNDIKQMCFKIYNLLKATT